AKEARWLLGAWKRHQHPELLDIYLEEHRIQIILRRILSDDSCGIDVGAHIGSFLSLLLRYAPYGHHLAIEASPTRGRRLQKKFPKVMVINAALSDETGVSGFIENSKEPGYSRLTTEGGTCKVPTMRLDEIDIARVELIKLDIEGGELNALRGGINTI